MHHMMSRGMDYKLCGITFRLKLYIFGYEYLEVCAAGKNGGPKSDKVAHMIKESAPYKPFTSDLYAEVGEAKKTIGCVNVFAKNCSQPEMSNEKRDEASAGG